MFEIYTTISRSEMDCFFPRFSTDFSPRRTINSILRYTLLRINGSSIFDSDRNVDDMFAYKEFDARYITARDFNTVLSRNENNTLYLVYNYDEDIHLNLDGYEEINSTTYPASSFLSISNLRQSHAYCNKKDKKMIVTLTSTVNETWFTRFLSMLLPIISYTYDLTLNEKDMELSHAIFNKTLEIAEQIINDICEEFELLKQYKLYKLRGCYKGYIDRKKIEINNQLASETRNIREYRSHIGSSLIKIDDYNAQLSGLELVDVNKIDQQLIDFFSVRKNIIIDNANNGQIVYYIDDTIEFYDADELKRIFNNPNSYLHGYTDKVQNLCREIFLNNRGKLLTRAYFSFEALKILNPLSHTGEYPNRIPHPHLYHHACLGGNELPIQQYLQDGDWDMAIDQSIAATKNLNFGDSTVFKHVLDFFRDYDDYEECRFILAENGVAMNIQEFLKYLNENPLNEDTTNNEENNSLNEGETDNE